MLTDFNPAPLRWLYVDFNSYFASVEQQLRPQLRGRPVAVVPVETDSTCAIAASYEAKAFGIKTGTPIYEAKRRCPDLVCVLADHSRYVDFHQRILVEVDRHIPVTAVCSIDEVACRLMNNETSHQRAQEIALSLKAGLSQNVGKYITCSIGIAPNKYLAKVATDLHKPNGLTFFESGDFPSKLLPLQLSDLPGIGRHMEVRLKAAGITRMENLLSLSPKHMRALWKNVWGERLWYLLRGWEIPEEESQRSSMGHSHVLAPEFRPPPLAFQIAQRLVIKATSRLRRLGYFAKAMDLSVRLENGEKHFWEARCQPSQDSFTFFHTLQDGWNEIFQERKNDRVRKISITLFQLTPHRSSETDLFEDSTESKKQKHEKVSHVMDRINQQFGRDAILLGMTSRQGRNFSGTKIAFNRIPEKEEFQE